MRCMSLSPSDISIAHRLTAGRNDTKRQIIVRFKSRCIRHIYSVYRVYSAEEVAERFVYFHIHLRTPHKNGVRSVLRSQETCQGKTASLSMVEWTGSSDMFNRSHYPTDCCQVFGGHDWSAS